MEDEKKIKTKLEKVRVFKIILSLLCVGVRMKTFIYFKKKCAKISREEQLLSNFVKEPKMRRKKTKVVW